MLHFINTTFWKQLFGRQADGLEQSNTDDSEYWLSDKGPVTNKFTSIGKDRNFSGPNCAFFIAGILQGFLCGANLTARVTPVVHSPEAEPGDHTTAATNADGENPYVSGGGSGAQQRTPTNIYVIKFNQDVYDRNCALEK